MSYHYSDPSRENDLHALPDVEVFKVGSARAPWGYPIIHEDGTPFEPGWYWWFCSPGCLPDCEAVGPFKTHHDALMDCRIYVES